MYVLIDVNINRVPLMRSLNAVVLMKKRRGRSDVQFPFERPLNLERRVQDVCWLIDTAFSAAVVWTALPMRLAVGGLGWHSRPCPTRAEPHLPSPFCDLLYGECQR